MSSTPITLTVVGCGNRGTVYSNYAMIYPNQVQVIAACDPNPIRLENLCTIHNIHNTNRFPDWQTLALQPRISDGVIIATQDQDHLEPCLALAKLGYAILLEKPMSTNLTQCQLITESINFYKVPFAVGHVLRYTLINLKLREMLQQNLIGKLVNIQHLEPIGYYHFAHSFVRGNWKNKAKSTFALMSKSCHDLDLINYFIQSKCIKIHSFGSLAHFNLKNLPKELQKEEVDSCWDCKVQDRCPYSAKKIYLDWKDIKGKDFFAKQIVDVVDIENLTKAIKLGPYGKCVYNTDNDVCDNQVVNLQFENEVSVSFTMVAFTEKLCQRKTNFYGSLGELRSDGNRFIEHFDFLTEKLTVYDLEDLTFKDSGSSHGDADYRLMKAFVETVHNYKNNIKESNILCDADQALESHRWVFAAELARLTDKVIDPNLITEQMLKEAGVY